MCCLLLEGRSRSNAGGQSFYIDIENELDLLRSTAAAGSIAVNSLKNAGITEEPTGRRSLARQKKRPKY